VTNASSEPEHPRTLVAPLTPAARQRVFALLREELARTTSEAVAQGTPAELLAERLEERVAELRRQIATADGDSQS
jgi:hypothetical protein